MPESTPPEIQPEDLGLDKPIPDRNTVDPVSAQISELYARITVLEDQLALVVEGYEWIADEVRPLFGMNHLARVFDAIFIKLTK